jgi:anti-anti-sigma factor
MPEAATHQCSGSEEPGTEATTPLSLAARDPVRALIPTGRAPHTSGSQLVPYDTSDIVVAEGGAVTTIVVQGEFDLALSTHATPFFNVVLRSAVPAVLIDLGRVTFIDATGVALILNAYRRLDYADRRLAVFCPGGQPRKVFKLVGIERQLPLFHARAPALEALTS